MPDLRDQSEITSHVGLRIAIEPDDYAELRLTRGSESFSARCSNTGKDGLADLLRSLLCLTEHPRCQSTAKWRYIGETWFVFDQDSSGLTINVAEFDESVLNLPGEKWVATYVFREVVFHALIDAGLFIAIVIAEFDRLRAELGVVGYKRAWGFAFPQGAVDELRDLLESS
jgi:hypothetical protein